MRPKQLLHLRKYLIMNMLQDYGYAWYYAELTSAEQQACYTTTTVTVLIPASGRSDSEYTIQVPTFQDFMLVHISIEPQ